MLKHVLKITENEQPKSQSQSVDISHGRHLVRKVSVFDITPLVSQSLDKLKSSKITSLIKLEKSGTRGKKDYEILPIRSAAYQCQRKYSPQKFAGIGRFKIRYIG